MPEDVWQSGEDYEGYIGRWSRAVAARFIDWLAARPGLRWLDVGCGTGAVTAAVLERADPAAVIATDSSQGFVEAAKRRFDDARVTFGVHDAAHPPAGPFDAVVSGLVINFVPDLGAVLRALRQASAGGFVAAYVWDYAGRMELLRHFWDAAADLDPGAKQLDEGLRFPICDPARLEAAWIDAGFSDVATTAIDVRTEFSDFDDLWTPFLGGQGPAPGYVRSLSPGAVESLRRSLQSRVGASTGPITLTARAWAVRGASPS